MKTKTKTIVFNNCNFQLDIFGNGSVYPKTSDILHYVGLSQMGEQQIDQMNRLLNEHEFTKAIRFVAYILDISDKKAYVRIIKSHIVQFGIALTYGKLVRRFDQKKLNFETFLQLMKLFTDPTYEVIIELFKNEGFTSKKVKDSLISSGFVPKAKMILSEHEYNLI